MPKYNSYPLKASPETGDTILIYDSTNQKNKQTYFSSFFSWALSNIRTSNFSNLQTAAKTLEGSINEVKNTADSVTSYVALTSGQINTLKALVDDD